FYAGGSDRVVITTAGNVGIGNASPTGLLHVSSSALYVSSTSGNVGIGTTAPSSTLHVISGHIQFPFVTSAPAATECDVAGEAGRVVVYSNTATAGDAQLYVCDWNGTTGAWTVK
ncbi:MAG: hypothetical protein AAB772_01325, partial [Patescibacteria group bacterium]